MAKEFLAETITTIKLIDFIKELEKHDLKITLTEKIENKTTLESINEIIEKLSEKDDGTYSIDDISRLIQVRPSEIKFWCKRLKDILKIDVDGLNVKFTAKDLDNLKIVKSLRDDGYGLDYIEYILGQAN